MDVCMYISLPHICLQVIRPKLLIGIRYLKSRLNLNIIITPTILLRSLVIIVDLRLCARHANPLTSPSFSIWLCHVMTIEYRPLAGWNVYISFIHDLLLSRHCYAYYIL